MPRRLIKLLGLDRSVALAGVGRGLGMVLGPIGSVVVVWTLSAQEQGLYYLFLSLVSLKAFFDLGASASIAQMTPHLCKANGDGTEGPDSSFIHVAVSWMNKVALGFGLFCGVFGIGYLYWSGQASVATQAMWLATVCTTALTGSQEGRLQVVYGSGRVDAISKLRFSSLLVQYPVQWVLLLSGASLFSFSASALAVYIFQRMTLRRKFPALWPSGDFSGVRAKELKTELGFLIRRASLTYISGVLVSQVQQPIVFKTLGPEQSAKLGLSGMIGSTLIGLSSLWCLTMFPRFARKVAEGAIQDAYRDFRMTFLRTVAVATGGFAAALVAISFLHYIPRFSERLMSIPQVLPLFAALWLGNIALSMTYWPRSFKVEPFAMVACSQMIVSPLAVWFFSRWLGLTGVGWGNLCSWIVGVFGIALVTRRFIPSFDRRPKVSALDIT
ncbi:lipopolysaccharide biosynthesis protein [Luteolibacter sp. Populi]|uniref:lipopolysaccharide biosynthesis protein n=1 Tax=Luteolibacter sp. Populi TaxID=3230487 RepID=UPI0034677204